MRVQLLKSSSKTYLGARAITSFISLIFAFLYSRSLGIENRSVIAFVMTSNALTWVVITSGTTLTLRKLNPKISEINTLRSFFSLYIVEFIVSTLFFITLTLTYTISKNEIPLNLVIGVFLYFLMSGLHSLSVELLLAFNSFKLSGYLDVTTIIMQITLFLIFSKSQIFSTANNLLAAFSMSYAVIFLVAFSHLTLKLGLRVGFSHPGYFYRMTKGHHSLGITIGIMDRIDRLIIGFMLPIDVLGRYAVMSGMISVFRFIPDSISKLFVSKNLSSKIILPRRKFYIGITIIVFTLTLSTSTNLTIGFILGKDWLLPLNVTLFFILQESFRSIFQIQANRLIAEGRSNSVHKQATLIPIVSIIFALMFVPFFGLYGVQFSISVAFVISIFILKRSIQSD